MDVVAKYNELLEAEIKNVQRYGNDVLSINKAVTADYYALAKKEPLFFWFGAATLGSHQIGRNLNAVTTPPLKSCEKTQLIAKAFSYGNQEIHHNLVVLYKLYKQYGITALEQLKTERNDLINKEGLNGFKLYDGLLKAAKETAAQLAMQTGDFSYTAEDPRTIRALLNNADYMKIAKKGSIDWVGQEQTFVQPMYDKSFEGSALTLKELIQEQGLFSDVGNLIWDELKLSGAVILNGYLSTKGLDFSDFQTRMDFFKNVFDGYFTILQSEGGAEELTTKREQIANELGIKPPITEAQVPKFDHDFAVTWDGNLGKWRALTPQDAPKVSEGKWMPSGVDQAITNITKNGPLVDNTLYFDSNSGRLFLYGKYEALSKLPTNLIWFTKQTYYSSNGAVEGAIYVPFELYIQGKKSLKDGYWSTTNDAVKGFIQLLSDIYAEGTQAVEPENMQANEVETTPTAEAANLANGDFAFKWDKLQKKWVLADAAFPAVEIDPLPVGALLTKKDYTILPAGTLLPGDTFFYDNDDKKLYHLRGPNNEASKPPFPDDFGKWSHWDPTYFKTILLELDKMPYSNNSIYPNIANYKLYTMAVKKEVVEKTALLNELGELGQQLLKEMADAPLVDSLEGKTSTELTSFDSMEEKKTLLQDSHFSLDNKQGAGINSLALNENDIIHSNSNTIDFSSLNETHPEMKMPSNLVASMEFASGTTVEFAQNSMSHEYLAHLAESDNHNLLSSNY